MTGIGIDLDDLARAAGLDPDSSRYRLASQLAEADDQLLEDLVCLRHAKGLTQQDVASRIGRNKSVVSNFEQLSADPRLSTVRRYAAAIGATVRHEVRDFDTLRSTDYDAILEDRFEFVIRDALLRAGTPPRKDMWSKSVGFANVIEPKTNVIEMEPARRRLRRRELSQSEERRTALCVDG